MNKPTIHDLRWLLLSLGLTMALHATHLSLWIPVLIAAFGTWRYLVEKNNWQLPRLWLLLPITLLAALGVMVTYHGLFGRDASVALLSLMLALKLMETRDQRDFVLLIFSGFFLTITAFLFNQSITAGAYMLVPVVCLTATLVGISHAKSRTGGDLPWHFQGKLAGVLLVQAMPVMLALFFLFPRIPGPLWGVPQDAYSSMSGLSDSMAPGNISQLSLSGAIAFRVQFQGNIPPVNQLYWRGPVLWRFDGRTWHMNNTQMRLPAETLDVHGPPTLYSMTLEPHNRNWLLMLDMPTTLPSDAIISRDGQVLSREPIRTRMRYAGSSNFNYTLGKELDARERKLALEIPAAENPRTLELAKGWRGANAETIVQSALTMFRQQNFVYTLAPPLQGASNPMDDFLFNSRRGFCEHYAGSFVYLMRAAGVPARVVTGYQGGEVNNIGNYLIVRQSDAHAWAEVWLQGRGWVRVDPTAAVSPNRIEQGIASALPDSDALPLLTRRDYPLLRKLYLNWDAMNNGWNQWVLGYNQQKQMELLSRLAGSQISWQDMAIALMVTVGSVVLALSFFLLRGRRVKIDPLQRWYSKFLRKLERAGLKRHGHEGPLDFSKRAARRLPGKADAIVRISDTYARLRYRSDNNPQALEAFKRMIRNFRNR